MKREVTKIETCCDACHEPTYIKICLGCGLEHCWKCREIQGVDYNHAVGLCGTGDGYFCHKCNFNPPEKVRILWFAYVEIRRLEEERKSYQKYFDDRRVSTEKRLKDLLSRTP